MNTATKPVSDSTTQVGQDHVATRVLLVLGTNTQTHKPNTPNTQWKTGQLAVWVGQADGSCRSDR
jgi:hypothetical protein